MRLALFDDYRLGVVEGDQLADVTDALDEHDTEWPFVFVPRTIIHFDRVRPRIESKLASARRIPLAQVRLRPPTPAPSKIAAAASNYRAHNAEMQKYFAEGRFGTTQSGPQHLRSGLSDVPGRPPGERGDVFLKSPSSIIGPGDTILLPDTTPGREVHHEPELAAVIGRECYRVSPSQALDYVFGYTALLDITVRGEGDRSRRKSYRGFTPIGPWIVLKEEISDPQDLDIKLWVNDELRQDANTSDMIETLAEIIEYSSYCYTLMPGDIVTTGSPDGVAPIKDGDVVKIEIEGIGSYSVDVEAL
ncbi:MAG TPA: fumarylacetoacetate hydrolase family protein [Chloroflexota bacterium]|nr:fumarylacetoacetate hydrolase family protein [Chloroflexota bacterium]